MKKFHFILIALICASGLVWLGCDMESSWVTGPDIEDTVSIGKAALPDVALENMMAVQDKHTSRLLELPGVVGTAIGIGPDGNPVIMVLTARQGIQGIPGNLDGVPVVVKVTGEIKALSKPSSPPGLSKIDPTARFDRPVPIGVSTGHPNITAGTIGCRVIDADGNVYALSNNHVYADENDAIEGDNVLQPGPYDGGTDPADEIGTLYDYEPILFDGSDNTIDAAIAKSSKDKLNNGTPSNGYGIPGSNIVPATLGLSVKKYGRTTGLTTGEIVLINASVNVTYSSGTAHFVDQIIVTPGTFSSGGDSGSLVVTGDGNNNPVGLLFAGSTTYTILNPIGAVLDRFNVTIDDGSGEEPPDNPPPSSVSVTGCEPSSGFVGTRLTVSVTGTGFQNGATVDFGGDGVVVQNVSFVNETQLVLSINIQRKAGTGLRDVTVTNPDGAFNVLPGGFTVTN